MESEFVLASFNICTHPKRRAATGMIGVILEVGEEQGIVVICKEMLVFKNNSSTNECKMQSTFPELARENRCTPQGLKCIGLFITNVWQTFDLNCSKEEYLDQKGCVRALWMTVDSKRTSQ